MPFKDPEKRRAYRRQYDKTYYHLKHPDAKTLSRHGWSHTRTYKAWRRMRVRCNWKNGTKYHLWGGRGITYTPRWESFLNFLEDMGVMPEGLSLERINNNLGYCKENCKWATITEQNRNRRRLS